MRLRFLILGRQNELEAYASRKNSSEDLASFPRPLGGSRDLLDFIDEKNHQQKSAHTLPVITHATNDQQRRNAYAGRCLRLAEKLLREGHYSRNSKTIQPFRKKISSVQQLLWSKFT